MPNKTVLQDRDAGDEEQGENEDEDDEDDEDDELDEDDDDKFEEEDVSNDLKSRPDRRKDLPDQPLSVKLIATRGIGPEAMSTMSATEIADTVLDLKHIRLDDERIAEIDNMEALGPNVTHLYLQRNRITKIENLESLQRLQVFEFRLTIECRNDF